MRTTAREQFDALEQALESDARDDEDWGLEAWSRVTRTLRELESRRSA
jgi:hypothetical protein